jgi:hypothetical protein
MPLLTSQFIGDMVGTAKRDALTPAGTVFNQYVATCDARVVAACKQAGYTIDLANPPTGDALEVLRSAALYCYVKMANLLRKDIVFPQGILDTLIDPENIASGVLPIPGLSPSQLGGAGGSQITAGTPGTSLTTSDRVFTRSTLGGF